jgi:hypothetical protein
MGVPANSQRQLLCRRESSKEGLQKPSVKGRRMKSKLALIAMLVCLAGGISAATAFAGKSGGSPQGSTTTCSDNEQGNANQQGNDQQGTANDIADAAGDVEQEAENQQGDDEQGDAQGPNDNSDEQGEDDCGDDGGDD